MSTTTKKILALALALAMLASFTACGSPKIEADSRPATVLAETFDVEKHTETSEGIYNAVLGDFIAAYNTAKEADNVSKRYALMAVAEAKLMESAVMMPTTTRGGNYAISRVAPYTFDWTLWGNDSDRFHQAVVATEPITSEHRAEMKAKWGELRGTGTYEQWAKDYLTGKGYTLKDSYTLTYPSDPQTWDAVATSRAADSEAIVNIYDGLMEYDVEGTLQPALAESYTVSADGLKYTFKLRSGLTWVDSQGRKVADLKADDFVAGMQHMMDTLGGLEYLVQGIIVGANEYIGGEITDFSKVGVKALDDTTVEYTLEAPCSYFLTMLGYNVFAPVSRSYYASQGGKFGEEYDASASTYLYGTDPDHVAYCGPYLVTNCTAKNTIVFKANPAYWNKDKINAKTITWLYNDGSDATKAYNDMLAGTIDGCGLNASALELAKKDGNFAKYGYTSATDATSYMAFWNVNRVAFANVNDATTVVSPQTVYDATRTKLAMQNAHFRRAISFAVDRGAYNAQSVGEELKLVSLRNSYTPGNFVSLDEDVTIAINGKDTTFKAGTYYGAIMQAQIDADKVAIKVWDPKADDGIGSGDGFDGWYNVENAKAELKAAVKELKSQGVVIDAKNPIYIDLPYPSNSETYTNKASAMKQSIEASLEGAVIVNLTEGVNYDEWYYAGYYTDFGYEANYDCYDLSGWGPDYGDPSTYLDTFLPDYAGYMIKCIGIY